MLHGNDTIRAKEPKLIALPTGEVYSVFVKLIDSIASEQPDILKVLLEKEAVYRIQTGKCCSAVDDQKSGIEHRIL